MIKALSTLFLAIAILGSVVLPAQQIFIRRTAFTGDPSTICTTLVYWLEQTTISGGSDGSEIASWNDSSGNGRNFSCDTASFVCPEYESGPGGLIMARNGGSLTDYLTTTNGDNIPEDMTVAMVASTPNTENGPYIGLDETSGDLLGIESDGTFGAYVNSVPIVWDVESSSGVVPTDGSLYAVIWERTDTTGDHKIWLDGTELTPASETADSGGWFFGSMFEEGDGGNIAEIVICNEIGVADDIQLYFEATFTF